MVNSTIVISNYNYNRYVGAAIESCFQQRGQCNIIAIDDASTNNSWEIIKKFVPRSSKNDKKYLAIRLLENSKGNARGRNIGISLCQTKYITFLDSDDILLPHSIIPREEILIDFKYVWVHSNICKISTEESQYYNILKEYHNKNDGPMPPVIRCETMKDKNFYRSVMGSSVMLERSVFEKIGLFDEDMRWKIDREMWVRLITRNIEPYFISKVLMLYRSHKDQATKNRKKKDPVRVNAFFNKVVKLRKENGINSETTLMLDDYNAENFIAEMKGDL